MRKYNSKLLALGALAMMGALASAQRVHVVVDEQPVSFTGQGARMIGDRVVVPLRGVFEKLGATVNWNSSDQTILATSGSKEVWLQIGNREAKINGSPVMLDQSAVLYGGTTMVPLRFVSESLGADVRWHDAMQTVYISTGAAASLGEDLNRERDRDRDRDSGWKQIMLQSGTVIPLVLDTPLSSRTAREGDKFVARIDTKNENDYEGLPRGTVVHGHVTYARAMSGRDPGALAVAYDSIVTPSGTKVPIEGSLISLDSKNVENKDGRLVAKNTSSNKNNQNVWIGAGAGAVLAVITKGNILTNSVIGAALGYLYDQISKDSKPADVTLNAGTTFGVRLDDTLTARIER